MTCQITHATHRALALSIIYVAPICTVAADWPNWRGPNHDDTIDAPGQFSDRAFGLEIVWKKTIGAGYSGMTVAQGRLLTMFADGESDLLAAFNAKTGIHLTPQPRILGGHPCFFLSAFPAMRRHCALLRRGHGAFLLVVLCCPTSRHQLQKFGAKRD